jgi:hypothetical protein
MSSVRYDFAGKLGKAVRSSTGGIIVPGRIAKTGVLAYRNPDGSVRKEWRPADEVFREDSLRGLNGAPVTLVHEMSPTNRVGFVVHGSVRRDGDHVMAELHISDPDTIRRIDAGELAELSGGYVVEFDETPGTTDQGEHYDGTQRRITYDHVALLPPGTSRCGETCALRLDGEATDWIVAQQLALQFPTLKPEEIADLLTIVDHDERQRRAAQIEEHRYRELTGAKDRLAASGRGDESDSLTYKENRMTDLNRPLNVVGGVDQDAYQYRLKKQLAEYQRQDAARADCSCDDTARADADDDADVAELKMLERNVNGWKNPAPSSENAKARADAASENDDESAVAEAAFLERTRNAWRK